MKRGAMNHQVWKSSEVKAIAKLLNFILTAGGKHSSGFKSLCIYQALQRTEQIKRITSKKLYCANLTQNASAAAQITNRLILLAHVLFNRISHKPTLRDNFIRLTKYLYIYQIITNVHCNLDVQGWKETSLVMLIILLT